MTSLQWRYPGSRWWKFDFHTHTPASRDTSAWQNAIGTSKELTPETWLLKYMAAKIDCVAITDHNSGEWIDPLKAAYEDMKACADAGRAPEGFQELALFPGVEISVSGGFHLLAIFDPGSTTRTITDLLAAVGYQGTDGDSDGVTREGPERVIEEVLTARGIPIPAHADRPDETGKGLLACRDGGGASRLDANTIRGILDKAQLLAIEWEDMNRSPPECARTIVEKLTWVLGSDCHSFRGSAVPGSRYTWVKIAKPTLEGLRLALLDGDGVSIRRSDQGAFDPFRIPAHIITAIEIDQAHYMGNGQPARLGCSPYFNAIIGGRGTGKSTVVQALRLVTRREQELKSLGEQSEPWKQFEAFRRIAKGRDDKGALYPNTELRVEWKHDETLLRLRWRADGQGSVVEEWNEESEWQPSASQSINPARFPVRIFSQGQIAAMAGSGRQTLLSERELRALIDVTDERFADDILSIQDGEASGGMAFDLAQADEADKAEAMDTVKQYLLNVETRLGGHLRNHLRRKHEKSEFADHVLSWFPEDDLRIEYRRDGRWTSINQGSQGQRSAALLAFLLAFGEEPIVLDQPEGDLDNHLIYGLMVRQIRENKLRRQLIIVTHNPNVVVNGDAELVHVMEFGRGQCFVQQSGALQESAVRGEVCRVMEGGHEAFARRWKRLGIEV